MSNNPGLYAFLEPKESMDTPFQPVGAENNTRPFPGRNSENIPLRAAHPQYLDMAIAPLPSWTDS